MNAFVYNASEKQNAGASPAAEKRTHARSCARTVPSPRRLRRFRGLALILAFLFCLALLPHPAMAAGVTASGQCGSALTWTLDSEGTMTIRGTGRMDGMGMLGSMQPWNASLIRKLIVEEGVTSIGRSAFCGADQMTEVSLPGSLTSIDEEAFWYCKSLTSFSIPARLTSLSDAFSGCSGLEAFKVAPENPVFRSEDGVLFRGDMLAAYPMARRDKSYSIPDGVSAIARSAFSHVTELQEIILPNSLTTIDAFAFSFCTALRRVELGSSVAEIGISAFRGCAAIEEFAVAAGNPSFSALDGVLFNGDRTELLFYPLARSAAEYTVPDGVITVSRQAFEGCAALTKVTLPVGVTSIGQLAFYNCTGLSDVTIPASVTEFGGDAFGKTPWLASLGDYAVVNGVLLLYQGDAADAVIPDGVTKIASGAFNSNNTLTSIFIPDGVTEIGSCAVRFCPLLSHIIVPNSVVRIGSEAFECNGNLTSIRFGSGLEQIGSSAFYGTPLQDVYYTGTKEQWDRVTIDHDNEALTGAALHCGSLGPEPEIKTEVQASADVPAVLMQTACPETYDSLLVYGARYSAEGKMLGLETVEIPAGQAGELRVPFADGSYVRIFTLDTRSSAPISGACRIDRPLTD